MTLAGDFVIAWSSDNNDGSGRGIAARRYNSAGAQLGAQFLVNTTTANDQTRPAVSVDPTGAFTVTWASSGQVYCWYR